ncbi:MAG: 5'-deoxynucleotidase [Defluviitaleaceae bacterium]|nr:5'-deoxynucleotidase [Defluviitaleaceae bacterium]MCL2836986.1 5'-deoxynucleotidase [Defluviitaleaceae bacterium]
MEQSFLPMLFRMKHIMRWGLMFNTQPESLSLHSAECAFLAHFLAVLGNTYLDREHNADRIAALALFHDATEILTGDLPTPVKYFNGDIFAAYKGIEEAAADKLLEGLPGELRDIYSGYFKSGNEYETLLVKAADRLCAYIKCVNEVNAGNKEFEAPYEACRAKLRAAAADCPELELFTERFLDAFTLSLDNLNIKFVNK